MSFVGPRPLLPEYISRYTTYQRRRHAVKPGITGWAQVHGRNAITWDQKFSLDVWYVDHRSFCLDIKILWLTLVKSLSHDGISQPGHATMPEFMGTAKVNQQHE
jgi:lipopolysaccharide/colanic/teichoic acid biosynthesis glycosyltransferase